MAHVRGRLRRLTAHSELGACCKWLSRRIDRSEAFSSIEMVGVLAPLKSDFKETVPAQQANHQLLRSKDMA
ncbi:hypothetical protein AUC45_07090 [Erythrobacter sp. YT30]|nr:hypothetical protein AUC45_07090 [Erythrobacter sp. YT30]